MPAYSSSAAVFVVIYLEKNYVAVTAMRNAAAINPTSVLWFIGSTNTSLKKPLRAAISTNDQNTITVARAKRMFRKKREESNRRKVFICHGKMLSLYPET